MENGIQFVESAARKITNLGAPKISVVMNAGREIATPSDMLETVDKILSKLTTTPEAHGSRFGLIIFDNELKPVKESYEPEEAVRNNQLIVESIFEHASSKVSQIYHSPRIQEWLSKPLKDYEKTVLELIKSFPTHLFGERAKIFWQDHAKSGYKHIRGVAFEAALVDLIDEVIKRDILDEELEEMLLKKAEENLEIVKTINLESLRKMIEITEETEKTVKKLIIQRFEQLSGYKKAIVLSYSLGLAQKSLTPRDFTIFDELQKIFESISEEKRKELFGSKYVWFSRIKQNIEKLSEKAKKELSFELETQFGIEFRYSLDLDCWLLRTVKSDIEYLFDWVQELVNKP